MRTATGTDAADGGAAGAEADLASAIAAMEALGVEVDRGEAAAWLEAVAAATADPGEFVIRNGVGGHELALLDFDHGPGALARLRPLANLVRSPAADGLQVALAVAGSVAQGRIQPFPADVDFFERVNILAPSATIARDRLADHVRACLGRTAAHPALAVEEVLFGKTAGGRPRCWRRHDLPDVAALDAPDPQRLTAWSDAAQDPGFVKLTWFLRDAALGGPIWLSKVIDATWQGPDGRVRSLDGAIDAEFQQIYLGEADAVLARRLTAGLGVVDREAYARAMEREVVVYRRADPPNEGKAAKRLYNLCRLTGRTLAAVFLRELFDEPKARLYGMRRLLDALAVECGSDPERALAGLTALVEEVAGHVAHEAGGAEPAAVALVQAVADCRALVAAPGGVAECGQRLAGTVAALDEALERYVGALFRQRLTGYGPTAALLAELDERYPDR